MDDTILCSGDPSGGRNFSMDSDTLMQNDNEQNV